MGDNNNIVNGWEYKTEITPTILPKDKNLQNTYLTNYNLAYNNFIKSLLLEKNELDYIISTVSKTIDYKTKKPCTKYRYIIDCSKDNDIINKDSEYPIEFLKSKFLIFKDKKIKGTLISHYKPLGFYVKGPIELINKNDIVKYYIELYWKPH